VNDESDLYDSVLLTSIHTSKAQQIEFGYHPEFKRFGHIPPAFNFFLPQALLVKA
jgi:hypothetical protein